MRAAHNGNLLLRPHIEEMIVAVGIFIAAARPLHNNAREAAFVHLAVREYPEGVDAL
jgi:hypothetical protein